jgi:hypothetical protein
VWRFCKAAAAWKKGKGKNLGLISLQQLFHPPPQLICRNSLLLILSIDRVIRDTRMSQMSYFEFGFTVYTFESRCRTKNNFPIAAQYRGWVTSRRGGNGRKRNQNKDRFFTTVQTSNRGAN